MLNYRMSETGFPVVYLHGFLESISMWDALPPLANFSSIEIDLPGHGASKERITSIADMADAVIETLDALKVREFHVVGHSMGGYVALEIKRKLNRCQKVVLLNSNFWGDNIIKQRDRKRVANIVKKNKSIFLYEAIPNLFLNPAKFDTEVKALIEEALQMSSVAIASASIAMSQRTDHTEAIAGIKQELLVIQGKEDAIVAAERMRLLADQLQFAYTEIPNCGHMAHLEASDVVHATIRDFLT